MDELGGGGWPAAEVAQACFYPTSETAEWFLDFRGDADSPSMN